MKPNEPRPPDTLPPCTSERDPQERPGGGDPRPSFEDVYRTTFRPVWRLLRRVGIPERHQADVAQEAFLRIARRLSTYDPALDLLTWVLKVANHAATRHRRLARNRHELLADADDVGGLVHDPQFREGEDLAQHARDLERLRLVGRLLQAISNDRARAVVLLHDLEERSLADVARVLTLPWSTACDLLARGRKAFVAAVNALTPREREALGLRGRGVVAFFPFDRVGLAEAERRLEAGEDLARLQAELWRCLRQSGQGGERVVDRTLRRVLGVLEPTRLSLWQVLGLSLVLLLTDGAGMGRVSQLAQLIQERAEPERIAPSGILVTPEHMAPASLAPLTATPAGGAELPGFAAAQRVTEVATSPAHATGTIPRAGRARGDDEKEARREDVLLDRARMHLTQAMPRADLALASLRLHAAKYPQHPRAPDREQLLRRALALAASETPGAAAATSHPTPRTGR